MSKLVLASKSPRRKELLEKLGIPFECIPAVNEEVIPEGTKVSDTAELLAMQKAAEVYDKLKAEGNDDVVVIGSDTIVTLDGIIYGKPSDEVDAVRMLRNLSGRTHEVLTGVCIKSGKGEKHFTNTSSVTFFDLSDEEIEAYVKTGEPMDKAGAYGIQGKGALLVKEIAGDFYSIMGFPIGEVARCLNGIM